MRVVDATITQLIPIYCQICDERIAMADPKYLSVPLHGDMFVSPYPDRMPEPVIQPAEWEFLRCPFCNSRPFIRSDEVLTEKGVIFHISTHAPGGDRPKNEASDCQIQPIDTFKTIFLCDCCDPPKEFKNKAGRSSHIRAMKGRVDKD